MNFNSIYKLINVFLLLIIIAFLFPILHSSFSDTSTYKNLYKKIVSTSNDHTTYNTIIDKNLEPNEDKVLNYFDILDRVKISDQQRDIIRFKKILYLIKISKIDEAKKLISKISPDSELKKMLEQIPLK